jgi:long-chain acyl-CoA synthetase
MSHVYEFTIGYLMFFLNGACVYYLEKPPTVTSLLPALKTVRPTIMLSVPIIMEKIFKNKIVPTFTGQPIVRFLYRLPPFRGLFHRIAGRSLKKTFGGRIKFFGIGGSKVDPVVERFMKEARFPYAIGYGLTETSPLLGGAGPKATIPGCIGVGMPGIELKVYDPDPASGVGELVVKGPNVMKGYYRDPELTKSAYTPDGWFRTGDLCTMKGRRAIISLKGRSKNMILGATGENIYPEDIEFVLNQHPFVAESLVVEGENRSLVALVQIDEERLAAEAKRRALAEGGQIHAMTEAMGTAMNEAAREMSNMLAYKREELMNEIKFFVNENVNRISRIDRVEPIDQFEKTASQKIKRYLYTIQGSMKGKQGSR